MEEQKKELQETMENTQEKKSPVQEAPKRKKNNILWIFAGIYLIYTGYNLCNGVLQGAEGSNWAFFAAGVAFALIGAGLIFVSGKTMLQERKEQKEEEDKAAAKQLEEEIKAAAEAPKKMSIAERANLASRLNEETDSQEASAETEE